MHQRFTTLAAGIAGALLTTGLLACTDRPDPAAVAETPPAATANAGPNSNRSAVQDALTRLLPNLTNREQAAAVEQSLRALDSALAGRGEDAAMRARAAVAAALADYERAGGGADAADLEAIRLALPPKP